jgi:hypothetical protein
MSTKKRTAYQQFVSNFAAQNPDRKWGKCEFLRAAAAAWRTDHPPKPKGPCVGKVQDDCKDPCGWANGKKRKYCHAKPVKRQVGGFNCSKQDKNLRDCLSGSTKCGTQIDNLNKCKKSIDQNDESANAPYNQTGGLFGGGVECGDKRQQKREKEYSACVDDEKKNLDIDCEPIRKQYNVCEGNKPEGKYGESTGKHLYPKERD